MNRTTETAVQPVSQMSSLSPVSQSFQTRGVRWGDGDVGVGPGVVLAAMLGLVLLGTQPTEAIAETLSQKPSPAVPAIEDTAPAASDVGRIDSRQLLAEARDRGGLTVLVEPRSAEFASALGQIPNAIVQTLVSDREELRRFRQRFHREGLYGRVSAVPWEEPYLPYADGMVNQLLVGEKASRLQRSEVERVLAPLGIAWMVDGEKVVTYRKPWPEDIDQWTHSRYDATGNAVSHDQRVGPPRFLQWTAGPRWNRGVKTSSMVTDRGRIFYILDDSHFAVQSSTWSLIARDASNGIRLWRQELDGWEGALGGKKVGPVQVHRRLVAKDDRVYATLGRQAAISVLEAATGEVIRTIEETEPTEEFLLSEGVLVALVNANPPAGLLPGIRAQKMKLVAAAADTGEVLWQHTAERILPLSMVADDKQVVYHDGRVIRSLDLCTGEPRWMSPPTGQQIEHRDRAAPDQPGAEKGTILLAPQFAPTMIIYLDVVAFAGGRQINVYSADNGEELWRSGYAPSNYSVPVDLFGFGGYLWGPDEGMNLWRPADDSLDFDAYSLHTGELERSVAGHYGFRFQHHRCHMMKVVDQTVLAARAGIEFLDTATGQVQPHHWTRGSCFYGVMPANGLLYVPPHNCACYVRAKLCGFLAMNSQPSLRRAEVRRQRRLQRGPAYGRSVEDDTTRDRETDWPTYRHDAGRSGRASTRVSATLVRQWQTALPGELTAPVVAAGQSYVASTDSHTLYALDAASGEPLWDVTFDGPIDSPPTVYRGLVLCGCRDGSVYALRAEDGALVWRFLACPQRRVIVSYGQLESVWPVHGSVLVVDDTAYFVAGRSSYLDGGMYLFGLDPRTGEVRIEETLCSRQADGSQTLDKQGVDGWLSDILASDGQRIFLRDKVFDRAGNLKEERVAHLHGADGFLSGDTTHRLLWTYAPMYTSPHQGAFYDVRLSRALFPSGRILVEDDEVVYGFGQNHYRQMQVRPGGEWALFAATKDNDVPLDLSAIEYRKLALSGEKSVRFRWWQPIPIRARALLKTEDALFVAGPPGPGATTRAALKGETEAQLLAVAPGDGRVLARMTLPATPVWDGMAAAGGKLYLALANGKVLCMQPADSEKP